MACWAMWLMVQSGKLGNVVDWQSGKLGNVVDGVKWLVGQCG